jgi:hypothetical protein
MKLVVPLCLMLLALTGSAFAQGINLMTDFKRPLTSEEIERQKAIDQAYKDSINKIPDQKGSSDPWGNVRASAPAKPAKSHAGAR